MEPPSKALAHLTGDDYERGLLKYLRKLFHFLKADFDFKEVPPTQQSELRFTNGSTLVVIRSEWEGPLVALDRAQNPRDANYGALPLWAIMTVRDSPNLYSESMPMIDKFVKWAELMPKCASDILRGDFSIEPEVDRLLAERKAAGEEWERRLYLDSAIGRASEAFQRKDYESVVRHLIPFIDQLPRAQAAKFEYARKQLANKP